MLAIMLAAMRHAWQAYRASVGPALLLSVMQGPEMPAQQASRQPAVTADLRLTAPHEH